jgi:plastocyanin
MLRRPAARAAVARPIVAATTLLLAIAVLLTVWPAVAGAASFEIDIADDGFKPPTLTVQAGDSVTWTNKGTRTHTVTSDAGTDLDSGNVGVGEAYGHVFETAGTYRYHCAIHPDRLRGTITVVAAPPTTPGGSAEPTPPAGTLPPNFSPFPTVGPPATQAPSGAPTASATVPGEQDGLGSAETAGLLLILVLLGLGAAVVWFVRRR